VLRGQGFPAQIRGARIGERSESRPRDGFGQAQCTGGSHAEPDATERVTSEVGEGVETGIYQLVENSSDKTRAFPLSFGSSRSAAAAGTCSLSARPPGNFGLTNGTEQLRASAGSPINIGNDWTILNAGFGSVLRGYILTPDKDTAGVRFIQKGGSKERDAGPAAALSIVFSATYLCRRAGSIAPLRVPINGQQSG
jgi:hypothetical protein